MSCDIYALPILEILREEYLWHGMQNFVDVAGIA